MADLARRATRWVGTFPYILTPIPNLYDHSFPRYGQITFLTFRRPTTLTFDLKFWKYLSVTVYPYVICMPSFIMIGWEMAEILHIEILRKHGQTNTHTNTQTNRQTDRHGHYNTSPSPYGGEVTTTDQTSVMHHIIISMCRGMHKRMSNQASTVVKCAYIRTWLWLWLWSIQNWDTMSIHSIMTPVGDVKMTILPPPPVSDHVKAAPWVYI